MTWKCNAHPPLLNGKPCGHVNTTGIRSSVTPSVCCEKCGCTKIASDRRQAQMEESNGR